MLAGLLGEVVEEVEEVEDEEDVVAVVDEVDEDDADDDDEEEEVVVCIEADVSLLVVVVGIAFVALTGNATCALLRGCEETVVAVVEDGREESEVDE